MLIKPERVVMKSLNMEDPGEMKLVEKLQEDLVEQKMVSEDFWRQLSELNEEQKQQRVIHKAQIKKIEDIEMRLQKQHEETMTEKSEIKNDIVILLDMTKKQQQR